MEGDGEGQYLDCTILSRLLSLNGSLLHMDVLCASAFLPHLIVKRDP